MNLFKSTLKGLVLAGLMLPALPGWTIDSISLEAGAGEKVKLVRAGVQWKWDRQWWQSNGTHIGGFWQLSLAQWRGTAHLGQPGVRQNITVLGLTPVFRFQRDSGTGPYLEGGIGAHLLSEHYDNNGKQLSTRFQFGDHIGVGYVFANGMDVGLSVQHFSNGGIREPNDGADFAVLRVVHAF